MSTDGVDFTEADLLFFATVESIIHRTLSPEQRAWYVKTRDSDFGGDPTLMWQEYHSTAPEAFQVSTEGCYYAVQLATARKQNRVVPHIPKERSEEHTSELQSLMRISYAVFCL